MAKMRSPNYPNHNLGAAIELVRKVFAKDHRNKVSRETLANHLGHDALSGPVLGKIGALRAFGLLEGSGEELRVSEDAVTALMAPEGSPDRKAALERLAFKPAIFQTIRAEYPARPSLANLTYWLIKQGFSEAAAAIAANSYLDTLSLVEGLSGSYSSPTGQEKSVEEDDQGKKPPLGPIVQNQPKKSLAMTGSERELITGLLSKGASFRLLVSGEVGVKEIERLIAKLELDKKILAEGDDAETDDREYHQTSLLRRTGG